jgi:hypothetical protein
MKLIKKSIIWLWELPQSIVLLIYRTYMIVMTYYYSDAVSIELEDEDETEKFHNEKVKEFKEKYKQFLFSISLFYWIMNFFKIYKIYIQKLIN